MPFLKPYMNKITAGFLSFLLLFFLLSPDHLLGAQLYKWKDEEGTVHMTDNVSNIPPQFRNQVQKKNLETSAEKVGNASTFSRIERNPGNGDHPRRRFTVPYQSFEGKSRRIIIPVTFNDSVTERMLLDTGSPGLMISPKLAGRLGLIDDEDGGLVIMASGIGGSVPAMLAVVNSMTVGDARAEFLPATIAEVPSNEFEGLVGMDFLANYRIGIDSNNSLLVFEELPPQRDTPGGHDEAWWRSNYQNISRLKTEWSNFLVSLEQQKMASSDTERIRKIATSQYEEASKLYQKLESFARENAVPTAWRH
jgi:hypothetical protein